MTTKSTSVFLGRFALACTAGFALAASQAAAAVIDISNATTPCESGWPDGGVRIDDVVGGGNTGRMIGVTQTHWTSGGFSVPVDLNGNTLILDSGGGNYANYAGPISGNGTVTIQDNGQTVGGSLGNTYTGTTNVNTVVTLNKSSGNALCGTITMSNGSYILLAASDQIDDASNMTLLGTARLDLAGFSDTINELHMVTGSSVQTGAGGVLKVAKLFINDVQQPETAKGAGDGLVLGSGYIEVGASGPLVITESPDIPANPVPGDTANTPNPASLTKLDWDDTLRAATYDVYLWPAADPKPSIL